MLNTGTVTKVNKYNSFSLQEFKDRRMIIMDDPNFDPGQHETFKSIFSGDECRLGGHSSPITY